jgi:hypothetical protein
MVPINPDALLTRPKTGAGLREEGYPVADKTLATLASRGGGPPYRRFGSRVLYRWGDALDWARSRLSPPISSTSELGPHDKNRPPSSAPVQRGRRPQSECCTARATCRTDPIP